MQHLIFLIAGSLFLASCLDDAEIKSLRSGATNVVHDERTEGDIQGRNTGTIVEEEVGDVDDEDADANQEFKDKLKEELAKKGKSITNTIYVNTFSLANKFPVSTVIENPDEEVIVVDQEQVLPNSKIHTKTVAGESTITKNVTYLAPDKRNESKSTNATDNYLNLYITIDDSESFNVPTLVGRTKAATTKLLDELWGTKMRIFISGFIGTSNSMDKYWIDTHNKTKAEVQTWLDGKINEIMVDATNGDEKVFASMHKLIYDYRNQKHGNSTNALFVISDAANCLTSQGEISSQCDVRNNNKSDHWDYLYVRDSGMHGLARRHLTLAGAYYKQSDNPGVCGIAEPKENNDSFPKGSQYEHFSLNFHNRTMADLTEARSPSPHTGDICSGTVDLSFVTAFTNDIKKVMRAKHVTAHTIEQFDNDNLNLKVTMDGGTLTTIAKHENRVLVFDPGLPADKTIQIQYHRNQSYEEGKTDFVNILHPHTAQDETLSARYTVGGETTTHACREASSFANLPAGVRCRHHGKSVYFRTASDIPDASEHNRTVTFTYKNVVSQESAIALTSGPSPFVPELVSLQSVPSAFEEYKNSAQFEFSNNNKSLTVTFENGPQYLYPGQYKVAYLRESDLVKDYTLPAKISSYYDPVCLKQDGAYEVQNGIITVNENDTLDCTKVTDQKVRLGSVLIDKHADGKRKFKIVFKSFSQDLPKVDLAYPAYQENVSVKVARIYEDLTAPLDPGQWDYVSHTIQFAQPVPPGYKIGLDYQFWPPLDSCYFVQFEVEDALVFFGKPGEEKTELKDVQFEVLDSSQPQSKLCLKPEHLQHGNDLIVTFTTREETELE